MLAQQGAGKSLDGPLRINVKMGSFCIRNGPFDLLCETSLEVFLGPFFFHYACGGNLYFHMHFYLMSYEAHTF